MSGHQTSKKVTFWWPNRATKISRWWCDENNIKQGRMLPSFNDYAKGKLPIFLGGKRSQIKPYLICSVNDKLPIFIFNVIRSRMLPLFISDAKDNHPTFIFSVTRSRMLPPFISDAKDKRPTFIFSVIRSRILPPLISDFFFFGPLNFLFGQLKIDN